MENITSSLLLTIALICVSCSSAQFCADIPLPSIGKLTGFDCFNNSRPADDTCCFCQFNTSSGICVADPDGDRFCVDHPCTAWPFVWINTTTTTDVPATDAPFLTIPNIPTPAPTTSLTTSSPSHITTSESPTRPAPIATTTEAPVFTTPAPVAITTTFTTDYPTPNPTTNAPIPTTTTEAPAFSTTILTTNAPTPTTTTEAPVSSTTIQTTQDPDDMCCNCLTLDSEPGCADSACEERLCGDYRMGKCCTSHWGPPCVHAAMDTCQNYKKCCGCLNKKRGGGCYDRECTRMICDTDPFCCYNQWDDICVMKASAECKDEPLPVCCECTAPRYGKGCERDTNCEETVCARDSFCCKYKWDLMCANKAAAKCRDTTQMSW